MTEYLDYGSLMHRMLSKKFTTDSLWLLMSQCIMAASGIGINTAITSSYGTQEFGAYALALKTYLILTLLGSLGTNVSALRYAAKLREDKEAFCQCLSTVIALTLGASLVVAIASFPLIRLLAPYFGIDRVGIHMNYFIIAIPLFCLNKTLFGILNGLERMRTISTLQSLRWILLITFTMGCIWSPHLGSTLLAVVFPSTEALLLIFSAWAMHDIFQLKTTLDRYWLQEHISFGKRSMTANILTDVNNSIDVFLVGFFLPLSAVGIYSFAADLAKNLFAIADTFANSFNPLITSLHARDRIDELKAHIAKIRNATYAIYLPLILLCIACYPYVIARYLDPALSESTSVFTIICIGVLLTSGYRHVHAILEYTGFPQTKMIVTLLTCACNIVLLCTLIPLFGIIGAAIATSLTYALTVLLLDISSKRKLGFSLLLIR